MSQRTIRFVYDDDLGIEIAADSLLDTPDEQLHLLRREAAARHISGRDRYFCPKCKGPVWPSLAKGRFFNHYAPADPECEWYTGKPSHVREIDRERFLFLTESPLHKRLVAFVHEITESDERFSWSKKDRERITDESSGLWRKPDVWAMFHDREVVFELQLSRTYLKDIVGRELFYREKSISMIWLFHGFERFKEMAAAKDIYFANFANALEINHEAESESRKAGKLKLKAHWFGYAPDARGALKGGWHSRIIDLDELRWDTQSCKPYFVNPLQNELEFLRSTHAEWLAKFEPAWLARHKKNHAWKERVFRRAWERFIDIFSHRELPGWEQAQADQIDVVLDHLYALRNGSLHFGKKNLIAAMNTMLEYRRDFTSTLVAAAHAFDRAELLATKSVRAKMERNLGFDLHEEVGRLDTYNPLIVFLFPEMASRLKDAPQLETPVLY